jgi:O-antigen biosynthesis protein
VDVSVIIVSYNVKQYLRLCLDSVLRASANIGTGGFTDTEIIVIDNNSTDGTGEMMNGSYPEIMFIPNSDNRGFAVACNQGIRRSSGNYILILNPDTIVPSDSLRKCKSFMDGHSGAGALGARLNDINGRFLPESKRGIPLPMTAFYRMTHIYRLFPRSSVFNRYYMGHCSVDSVAEVEAVTGAFLFMKREAMESAGLFDERYFMYGEDLDLCLQIKAAGYSIYYYPEVTVTHFKGRSGAMSGYRGIATFHNAMHLFIGKNFADRYSRLTRLMLHGAVFISMIISAIMLTPSVIIRKIL